MEQKSSIMGIYVCESVHLCMCMCECVSWCWFKPKKKSPTSRRVLKGSTFKDQSFSSFCYVFVFLPWSCWLRARTRGHEDRRPQQSQRREWHREQISEGPTTDQCSIFTWLRHPPSVWIDRPECVPRGWSINGVNTPQSPPENLLLFLKSAG